MFAAAESRKRSRQDDDEGLGSEDAHLEKRSRPTADPAGYGFHGHHDSVLSTPSSQVREQPKYDSDDELSSMVSEPGSPQDVSMSGDEDMDGATFSQSPEETRMMQPQALRHSPWGQRVQTHRVPTPTVAMRPGARSAQQKTGVRHHIRSRHPQEYISSDHLEVPSPIDEDEVLTPPSAAEAAGSQLSMLTVSDVDMDEDDSSVPTISIDPARPSNVHTNVDLNNDPDSAVDFEPMDNGPDNIVVRKQRQRSGALSNGNSPVRAGPSNPGARRGFSVGFRADCEKCRMRVPGHMNHFIA
ncbi:hypothetical protein M409DRAFT_66288 [Zasmidium cellare ATCC 36951]|uniref:Uncharacterized protein n=1 Tax=Zasmidium cellare ATCC 36951 TaxID=1080233 RepID=A0A6A6CJ82_ZASCE|nr:uncharacterized protein M409DRAFT_66288 [Zasmidium cellare ATCC 36951]KAF2167287.1 hypothetical protein M409DRAFT_66288 [Zasmidium cellare ATCC 36951]